MGPLGVKLLRLRRPLALAAQQVYDEWEQDEEGWDEHYGTGGICDDIADAMSAVLRGVERTMGSPIIEPGGQDGDEHAFLVVRTKSEAYAVDIPPSAYESGGGYRWKKKEGVELEAEDVIIEPLDPRWWKDEEEP